MLSKRGQALFFYAHLYDLTASGGFQGSPDMLPPAFEFLSFHASASRNHPFLMGSVTNWFYRGIAGIEPSEPGYRKFKISPFFNETIYSVQACLQTLFGEISVEPSRFEKEYVYNLTVPFGTEAEVILPVDSCGTVIVNDIAETVKEDRVILLFGGHYILHIRRI